MPSLYQMARQEVYVVATKKSFETYHMNTNFLAYQLYPQNKNSNSP